MKAYKLTDELGQTKLKTQWGPGVTIEVDPEYRGKGELCSRGWLHFYTHPLLAVLMNPIHAQFDPETMRMWEGEANGDLKDDRGLKMGCTRLTTLREIHVPRPTVEHRVAFAIYCVEALGYSEIMWCLWAEAWMKGTDRSYAAANAAANAANAANAAYAAANAANAANAERTWQTARLFAYLEGRA